MNILTKFPIGQYVDGDRSWLRIIDSRLKLILLSLFLISPIWSGLFWRLSLVLSLIIITLVSFLPIRIWWRSIIFLIFLSLFVGILSLLVASNMPSLDLPLRDPKELDILLKNNEAWNIFEFPSVKLGFINLGPYQLSKKAFELGIKTSTLIFTVIHSVNLVLLTTLSEDLVWAFNWFMNPLRKIGLPIDRWLFQLLLALRFIPLVQEEFQNMIKSVSVRAINFRELGIKNSINILLNIVERIFLNILLRVDQGADSLLAKSDFDLRIKRFKPYEKNNALTFFVNTISIFFICVAIFLRNQYGAL